MKTIFFILGCSLIALGMSDVSTELLSHSNAAKSAVPHIIYWVLLPLEKVIGKYTIPIIGLIMVLVSAFMGIKNKEKKKKSPNQSR
ncbi:hypothetical protein M5C97_19155 [Acidovorax sp. NCPPB 3859]|nr:MULTISPECIES: hypothetical protein [unclassified Acidovorax]MDA8452392.1 hypothetical protein [Acidovorax sp. GBBC 3297]MDA8461829.1 hypothetical protein [Acidovorax sp. GBBC 3333]MDA8466833.1 hypothetical protein [Acidovorax sp. GBBC 3332]MDA8471898.1 hypothetical protein [Acidovorax sp. GBBC 3299]WCM77609.1 hypothetical protein M5C94_19105 [Acidovorax sp. GBBC 712]